MKLPVKKYNLRRTSWLMIFSYLLLLAFTTQWLYTQYEREENHLKQELSKLFDGVQQGITDSLLLVSVIDPVLAGSKASAAQTATDAANLPLSDDSMRLLSSLLFRENNRDLSLQGLKMAVRKVRQLSKAEKLYLFHIDTTVFNDEYAERMRRNGWNFPVKWIATANKKPGAENYIFIPNRYLQSGHGVIISQYKPYLLQKLWPQAGFVLVLLGITLIAFYTTYRSLLRQIQLSALKDDFVSNISHELKTPIATVKVAIEAIQHFDTEGQKALTQEYLAMAAQELERLELLVNRSLHTSLLESGKLSIQPELHDLKMIIEEVLSAYQVRFVAYGATVQFESKGRHFMTMVDRLHMQGVLINLLDNSLKYGLEAIHICISLTENNDHLTISVTDNGPGIPDIYCKKVFEKFFRVPEGNQHNVKGYGLGLSYAAQVMQQHEGSIRVTNVATGGCSFVLSL